MPVVELGLDRSISCTGSVLGDSLGVELEPEVEVREGNGYKKPGKRVARWGGRRWLRANFFLSSWPWAGPEPMCPGTQCAACPQRH